MVDIATLSGALTAVGAADIAMLRNSLCGRVILASDTDYENARRVWNGNVDRRPALIARCVDTSDIHHVLCLTPELEVGTVLPGAAVVR